MQSVSHMITQTLLFKKINTVQEWSPPPRPFNVIISFTPSLNSVKSYTDLVTALLCGTKEENKNTICVIFQLEPKSITKQFHGVRKKLGSPCIVCDQ